MGALKHLYGHLDEAPAPLVGVRAEAEVRAGGIGWRWVGADAAVSHFWFPGDRAGGQRQDDDTELARSSARTKGTGILYEQRAARREYDRLRDGLLEWLVDTMAAGSPGAVRADVWRRLARLRQAAELVHEYEEAAGCPRTTSPLGYHVPAWRGAIAPAWQAGTLPDGVETVG